MDVVDKHIKKKKIYKKVAARSMKDALMVAEAAKKTREGFNSYFNLEASQPFHDSSQQQTLVFEDSLESSDNDWGGGNPNHQIRSDKDDDLVNELDHDDDKQRRRKSAARKKKYLEKHDQDKFGKAKTRRERHSSEKIPHSQCDDSVTDLRIATQGYIETLEQQGITQLRNQEAKRRYFDNRDLFAECAATVIDNDAIQFPANRTTFWNDLIGWVSAKSCDKRYDSNISRFVSYIFAKLSFVIPEDDATNARQYLIAARLKDDFLMQDLQSYTNKKYKNMDTDFKNRFRSGGMGTLKINPKSVEGSDSIHTEMQLLYSSEKQQLVDAAIKNREVIFAYSYYIPCQGNRDNRVNDCATSMAEFFKKINPAPLVVVGYSEVWKKTDAKAATERLNWAKITVIRR